MELLHEALALLVTDTLTVIGVMVIYLHYSLGR